MASPGNQYCANCIGILSFPIITLTIALKLKTLHLTLNGAADGVIFGGKMSGVDIWSRNTILLRIQLGELTVSAGILR